MYISPCWTANAEIFMIRKNVASEFVLSSPGVNRLGETKNRLPSSRLESQLSRSEFKSQLTEFFSNSKILSASGHDVIHVPGFISYLCFLLWQLWLSHPLHARVNTCVHLTNPCTKRKALSLTKQKSNIYKTKNDNIKKISHRNYITFPYAYLDITFNRWDYGRWYVWTGILISEA